MIILTLLLFNTLVSWYHMAWSTFGSGNGSVLVELKPPLHKAATFVAPLNDQKKTQDAQWSPKPRKFCFCVNAAARLLCLLWGTKTAVQRKQDGSRTIPIVPQWLPWSPNEGTVVATVIAQLTLLVGQSRLTCGTGEAEAFLRGDQWPTHVHPFCNYGDACAFLLPPLSDLRATEFLGDPCACYCFTFLTCSKLHSDHGVHGEVWTLYHPWTTKANFWPLLCLQRPPGQFCGRTGRHRGRSPRVKEV